MTDNYEYRRLRGMGVPHGYAVHLAQQAETVNLPVPKEQEDHIQEDLQEESPKKRPETKRLSE